MGDKTEEQAEQQLQAEHIEQRRALNNAYGSIVGQQTTNSFQAFTFEEAVDLLIETIEGAGTQLRPNLLGRVDQIENNVKKAVDELKKIPVDQVLAPDDERDVNTPETPQNA